MSLKHAKYSYIFLLSLILFAPPANANRGEAAPTKTTAPGASALLPSPPPSRASLKRRASAADGRKSSRKRQRASAGKVEHMQRAATIPGTGLSIGRGLSDKRYPPLVLVKPDAEETKSGEGSTMSATSP